MRSDSLDDAVGRLLGGSGWQVVSAERRPVDYDVFLAGRTVVRVRGTARRRAASARWTLVEKRSRGPGVAPAALVDGARRELDAYRSGLLDRAGPSVRAPRLLAAVEGSDGGVLLRLEALCWEPLDAGRLLRAAADLGGMAGRWAGRTPTVAGPEPDWVARKAQPATARAAVAVLERATAGRGAAARRAARALRLLAAQPRLRAMLHALPQTLCHHDAVGANVFHDGRATVLIDWETIGAGAVGADLASLLVASARRGDCSAALAAELQDRALERFVDGVRAEAPAIGPDDVRRGFHAAVGLSWKLAADLAAAREVGTPVRRGSAPDESPEEAAAQLELVADLVLDLGERALE